MKLLHRWKQTAIHNKALVLTSVIVAFGTLFYAAAAIFQIYLMDSAAKSSTKQTETLIVEMRRQSQSMQDAAAANKKAVELAERSINSTQEQSRLDQRAWMGFCDIPQWQTVVDKPLIVTVFFKNMGKTPAKKVQIAAVGEIVSKDASPNFSLENSAKRERTILVFPQQVVSHDVNVTPHTVLDGITFNGIRNGTKRIYIHGIHTYYDIFNRHQWVTFCFYLRADGSKTEICKEHNDTGTY